jgi:hypothetical protein
MHDLRSAASLTLYFVAATAVARSTATQAAARWLSRPRATDRIAAPAFIILLPALREQALVDGTLKHFASLDYPDDRYRVVVVTSEREDLDRRALASSLEVFIDALWTAKPQPDPDRYLTGHLTRPEIVRLMALRPTMTREEFARKVRAAFDDAPTTADLVDNVAASTPMVARLHSPASFERKAGQLRFAFDNLHQALADWNALAECRYVAMYDFDARPEAAALWAAAEAAASRAPILQQPGLTVTRSDGSAHSWFRIMDGQLHARLGLRVELSSLLLDGLLPDSRLPNAVLRSSIHTVGNGLFVDQTALRTLGGIPEVVDDLAIGWRAAATAIRIAPIRAPVFYDAYASARQATQSRRFISAGYLRAVADIQRAPGRVRFALPVQLGRIYYRLVQWSLGPALRLVFLTLCAVILPTQTLIVCCIIYSAFLIDIATVRHYWRLHGVDPDAGRFERFFTFVLSPIALLWYGAGARAGIRGVVMGTSSPPTTKTER